MTTVLDSTGKPYDAAQDDSPKVEKPRYHPPSAQAMIDAAKAANEAWDAMPKAGYAVQELAKGVAGFGDPAELAPVGGVTLQTKSGPKHIRVRRCTRTVKLVWDLTLQCQLDQHDSNLDPMHRHVLTVFTPDGNAKEVTILWKDLGPMSSLVLTKGT